MDTKIKTAMHSAFIDILEYLPNSSMRYPEYISPQDLYNKETRLLNWRLGITNINYHGRVPKQAKSKMKRKRTR